MAARPNPSRRQSGRALCAGLMLLGLAACGGAKAPETSYYRLHHVTDIPTRAGGPLPGVVDVPAFHADGLVNDRAIVYRKGPATVAAYSYHFWWEAPDTMLQDSLVDALRRANAFQLVTTPELRLDRSYEVIGRVRRFEQEGAGVNVEVELMLRLTTSGAPLLLKTYRQNVPAADTSIPAAVDAFSTAVDQIWAQFIADLDAVTPPAPSAPR
jgi:ABC-type uncharacterized transport system auxiliary subunit